jgi:hypothetical protein
VAMGKSPKIPHNKFDFALEDKPVITPIDDDLKSSVSPIPCTIL